MGADAVVLEPPFFCDYGLNVELGERVFFNFNCVMLDVCPVRIGDFTLFGPAVQILTPSTPRCGRAPRRARVRQADRDRLRVWVGGAEGSQFLPVVHRLEDGDRGGERRDAGSSEGVLFAAGNPCPG